MVRVDHVSVHLESQNSLRRVYVIHHQLEALHGIAVSRDVQQRVIIAFALDL